MGILAWARALVILFVVSCSLTVSQAITGNVPAITAALRAGHFDEALRLLSADIQKSPKSAQLWTLRGIAFSGKGSKKQALDAFHQALQFSPDYLPALEGAAQIAYESGDKEAAPVLQHILQLRPDDLTSHAMLAVLAYHRRDCVTAVAHFERSGELPDRQPDALQEYGTCLLKLKQTEKAISVFARAAEQPNADSAARYRLAAAQLMAQRPKDAIATLQPLLQQNPKDAEVTELAAAAYEADGNTPEAVRTLRQAIVTDPHNINLYLDFANICLDHQSFSVGVDMINAGLAAEPKAAELYVARGILYVQLADYEKAEADFARADVLDPRRSLGAAAEGLAAVQKNDPVHALTTVRAKLRNKPNDPFLLYLQAEILAQKGPDPSSTEFREAVNSARKAVTIRPSLVAARDVLAKLYLQEGQNEAAVEQSRRALTSDPKDQTALYHLIQALRKSGQTNEIPDLLKKLAELRLQNTKEEAERNRYKLIEPPSSSPEKPQP